MLISNSPGGTRYQLAEDFSPQQYSGELGNSPKGTILLYKYKYNKESSLCDFMFLDICTQRLKSLVK